MIVQAGGICVLVQEPSQVSQACVSERTSDTASHEMRHLDLHQRLFYSQLNPTIAKLCMAALKKHPGSLRPFWQ